MCIKTLFFLFCLLMVFPLSAAPVIVVPNAEGKLVFPPESSYSYAAGFLRDHIQKSTGLTPEIIPESASKNRTDRIFLGNTAFSEANLPATPWQPEELRIQSVGKDLILRGEITSDGVDRGTLFAVYEFLERALDIRWFFPDDDRFYPPGLGTVIPKRESVPLQGWDIRDFPRCTQRDGGVSYYFESIKIQAAWHPVLRFGSSRPNLNANHTQIGWFDLYSESHPEYFAKNTAGTPRLNPKRPHRNYICPTLPAVLAQMLRNLDDADAGKPPRNAWGPRPPTRQCVFFAFNDGMTLDKTCHCPACFKRLRPDAPLPEQASELVFDFVVRYANAVRERDPKRRLATLAFHHYQSPPSERIVIPDNLELSYVTKRLHYTADPAIRNAEFARIRSWHERLGRDPERLRFWLNIVYPTTYTSDVPFFYPRLLRSWVREAMPYASAYFINGLNPYRNRSDKIAQRKAISTYPMVYLQSRILWNPEVDPDALLQDYSRNLYGPAQIPMNSLYALFIHRWEDFFDKNDDDADELRFIHTVRYPPEQIEKVKQLLDQAAALCPPDSLERTRILFWRDSIYSAFFEESRAFHEREKP